MFHNSKIQIRNKLLTYEKCVFVSLENVKSVGANSIRGRVAGVREIQNKMGAFWTPPPVSTTQTLLNAHSHTFRRRNSRRHCLRSSADYSRPWYAPQTATASVSCAGSRSFCRESACRPGSLDARFQRCRDNRRSNIRRVALFYAPLSVLILKCCPSQLVGL